MGTLFKTGADVTDFKKKTERRKRKKEAENNNDLAYVLRVGSCFDDI